MAQNVLTVTGVKKYFPVIRSGKGFHRKKKRLKAVDDVSLTIAKGETLGLVGESGCGKSTLGRVIMKLHPATEGRVFYGETEVTGLSAKQMRPLRRHVQMIFQDPNASLNPRATVRELIGCGKSLTASAVIGLLPPDTGYIAGGQILFEGEDLARKSNQQMRAIRGKKISMIFQEPMTSLNPVYRIGTQMREMLCAHRKAGFKEAREICVEMLRKVGIPAPESRIDEYPHQLSGGQRQRVMIAMALLSSPSLLIADEPTTALDVTIQAQILELIKTLRDETGTSVMLITHDMGVVAGNADKVLVMYAGKVFEYGAAEDIFAHPLHPYTRKLLASIPRPDVDVEFLTTIDGVVPPLGQMPRGCRFCTRCPYKTPLCEAEAPPRREEKGHLYYCHYDRQAQQDGA